jgi:hypothetical protein
MIKYKSQHLNTLTILISPYSTQSCHLVDKIGSVAYIRYTEAEQESILRSEVDSRNNSIQTSGGGRRSNTLRRWWGENGFIKEEQCFRPYVERRSDWGWKGGGGNYLNKRNDTKHSCYSITTQTNARVFRNMVYNITKKSSYLPSTRFH